MTGWLAFVGYLGLWLWGLSPWLRCAVLPGLEPHRGIPLLLHPTKGYRAAIFWPGARHLDELLGGPTGGGSSK